MKRIGILVVAYNAESTLSHVLSRIPAQVLEKVEEIFVFDDFSTDRTYEVGLAHRIPGGARLVVIRNERNLRYGGNQKRGYRHAMAKELDIVVLLHGDGQYAPEVMQSLLDPLERDEADMVMGSRMLIPGAARRGNMPRYKFLGNKILTFLQNAMIGQHFSEFHSGYRAYSVSALRDVPLETLTDGWHFDTQIILEFLARGLRIREVPIPTYYGDEICRVNGIPYALHCLRVTAAAAFRVRLGGLRGLRSPSRPAQ